jgi:chromosome segregation protein
VDEALVKETAATEERYEFISKQVEDLEKASKDLRMLAKELDQKIHAQFTNSLRHINEEFQKYFQLMFGGGRAKLTLVTSDPSTLLRAGMGQETQDMGHETADTDAEHVVEHGGIEIEVVIPRKKIKGMDMLSGGERSLVSIAVLFALISVSPPPFIVLDEADAALDEANTRRFADLVKHFAKKTQFVIVTHNRATMEAADVLYGVTMKEDGTSRVLSLKLE